MRTPCILAVIALLSLGLHWLFRINNQPEPLVLEPSEQMFSDAVNWKRFQKFMAVQQKDLIRATTNSQ